MSAKSASKKDIFETMPVPKAVASMAIPTIISQLVNLIYNLADTIYLGQTGDVYKTGAVTIAFTIFMMTISFSNLYGIGGGSHMARLSGRQDPENAKRVCAYSFYGAIGIALAYSLLIGALLTPILKLFGASENTMGFAKQYVLIVVVAGNVPVILSLASAHLLRNAGYSKQASIGLSGGGILNILLDPLFMFVLLPSGMEVVGAAVATLLSNIASCAYLTVTLGKLSRKAPVSISLKDARQARREDIRALYAVGIPSAILSGLFDVANIFLNKLMSGHGDLEVAAMGIVMKAERLPNAINIGLCQGMLPIVAYNFSSGNRERMQKTVSTVRLYGLIIGACCILLFELLAGPVVRVFLSTSSGDTAMAEKTLEFARLFLRIRCIAAIPQFLNYHTSFCLQAVGAGKETLLHAAVRELVFYVPFMFLLNALFSTTGLACALLAGEGFGAVFALLLFARWKRRHPAEIR